MGKIKTEKCVVSVFLAEGNGGSSTEATAIYDQAWK